MVDIIANRKAYAPDKNVSAAQISKFLNGDKESLAVSSVFYTIQGEGPYAGRPAVFVRLAGCNRGSKKGGDFCSGCDAAFELHKATIYSFDELEELIERKYNEGTRDNPILDEIRTKGWFKALNVLSKLSRRPLIVITGGEPSIHKNLSDFINAFSMAYQFQIESNGDFLLPDINYRDVHLCVSPKLTKNTISRMKKQVLDNAASFKFLISGEEESGYYHLPYDFILEASENNVNFRDLLRNGRVYVSPVAHYLRDLEEGEVSSLWTPGLMDVEKCKRSYRRAASFVEVLPYLRISTQSHLALSAE